MLPISRSALVGILGSVLLGTFGCGGPSSASDEMVTLRIAVGSSASAKTAANGLTPSALRLQSAASGTNGYRFVSAGVAFDGHQMIINSSSPPITIPRARMAEVVITDPHVASDDGFEYAGSATSTNLPAKLGANTAEPHDITWDSSNAQQDGTIALHFSGIHQGEGSGSASGGVPLNVSVSADITEEAAPFQVSGDYYRFDDKDYLSLTITPVPASVVLDTIHTGAQDANGRWTFSVPTSFFSAGAQFPLKLSDGTNTFKYMLNLN